MFCCVIISSPNLQCHNKMAQKFYVILQNVFGMFLNMNTDLKQDEIYDKSFF